MNSSKFLIPSVSGVLVLLCLSAVPVSAGSDDITIWRDNSIDLLYCITDECDDYLKGCYEDSDGCRPLMKCLSKCQLNDWKCLLAECREAIVPASRPRSFQKFTNLTTCVSKNCPRDEDDVEREAEEEAELDSLCIEKLVPISQLLNDTDMSSDCMSKLDIINSQVGESRDECKEDLDVIWMETRNFVNHPWGTHRCDCSCRFRRLKSRVERILLAKETDEEEVQEEEREQIHEDQGEYDGCENLEFGDEDDPWQDSDGDSCAVYKRHVCIPRLKPWNVNQIYHACESGDCAGTGGLYANQACCACGGGDKTGNYRRQQHVEQAKRAAALLKQSCMLTKCMDSLGDCQYEDGCVKGLHCVSNATCVVGESIYKCRDKCSSDLSAAAKDRLLDVMKCAGTENPQCVSAGGGGGYEPSHAHSSDGGHDATGGSSSSGGSNNHSSHTAIIVVFTLLGAVLVGGGAFGAWYWHKTRSDELSFRRVEVHDGEESILGNQPEL